VATVLIVEDEALVRTVLQMELEDAGYDVIIADCADAAIAILEARADIHLVFTDIDMPGSMDGLKLAACVSRPARLGRWRSQPTRFSFRNPTLARQLSMPFGRLSICSAPPVGRIFMIPHEDL